MTTLTNSFEGGTNGTTVTTVNSGGLSGSAFDATNVPGGGVVAYDNAHAAHGTLSCQLATTTAGNPWLAWTTSMGTQAQVWFRIYLYFTANPASQQRVVGFLSGASQGASFAISSGGKVQALDSSGSPTTTSTASIPLNQWFRLEGFAIGNASTGQTEVKIFTQADSSVPAETDTSAANKNTTGSLSAYRFGIGAGSGVANAGPWWMDDIGLSSTGYLGPASSASGRDSNPVHLFAAALGV